MEPTITPVKTVEVIHIESEDVMGEPLTIIDPSFVSISTCDPSSEMEVKEVNETTTNDVTGSPESGLTEPTIVTSEDIKVVQRESKKGIPLTIVDPSCVLIPACNSSSEMDIDVVKESKRNTKRKGRVVFIGNPGVGKSTIVNSVLGSSVFKSGVSNDGEGVSKRHGYKLMYQGPIEGWEICDTPGLADSSERISETAAKEIRKALLGECNYKVVFVVTMEGGRVSSEDRATIKACLDAVKDGFNYGVIFNKISPRLKQKFQRSDFFTLIQASLFSGLKKMPDAILLLSRSKAVDDKNDALLGNDERKHIENLILKVPPKMLEKKAIGEVKTPDKKAIDSAHEELIILRKKHGEKKKAMEQELKKLEHLREVQMKSLIDKQQEAIKALEIEMKDAKSNLEKVSKLSAKELQYYREMMKTIEKKRMLMEREHSAKLQKIREEAEREKQETEDLLIEDFFRNHNKKMKKVPKSVFEGLSKFNPMDKLRSLFIPS
mmetsp:Transcript_5317/g.7834  ORF Transcript_5317/g.7834 Transcript_5317/m.7834 type:complete len:492 (-) Transcript_5317:61-1536(-)